MDKLVLSEPLTTSTVHPGTVAARSDAECVVGRAREGRVPPEPDRSVARRGAQSQKGDRTLVCRLKDVGYK